MAEQSSGKGKAFLSYSRKDKEFVKKLEASLEGYGIVTWVDWEGIPLSADWMAEITAAIEGADAFIFVISPDSLASKVCGDELELGLKYNKKLVPVLHRIPEKDQPMHEKIAATNWVYLRETDDFDATMPNLVETINTDLGWVRQHTRLLERAVEWEGKKRNGSFLLNGSDLDDAERWVAESSGGLDRQVVPIQADYIRASRQQAIKRQRTVLTAVSVAMVISIFLAIMAVFQGIKAMRNAELAANNASTAQANEKLAKDNELRANDNAVLAQNNASTAQASEKLAKDNELRANDNAVLAQNNASTAVANEQARATQQALAVTAEQLAKENERLAIAQRSAAQANLVQQQPSQLFASTLLALYSLSISPSQIGEEVLRNNLNRMSVPLARFQQGSAITSVSFSPDGQNIVSTDAGSVAFVWKAENGVKLAELIHDAPINIAMFSPDGKWIVTGSDDGRARVWNAADFSLAAEYTASDKSPENAKRVADIDISFDSRYLAIGRNDGIVEVIEIASGKTVRKLPNEGKIYDVVFSPNGQRLAVSNDSGYTTVWHPIYGTSYITAKHNGDVYQAAFSPDSNYLVTASEDQTAQVWLINNGLRLTTLTHDDWLEGVSFSPDGLAFATASDDYTVRVWSADDFRELLRLRHEGFVQYVTYDPFGWWLASSSNDGTARVWDPVSGEEMIRIPLDGKGGPLRFSPDGRRLLTTNEFGELRIWDLSQLDSAELIIENDDLVRSVSFSNDGRWLISGTDDSLVRLWDMNLINEYLYNNGSGENLERTIYQLESGFIRNLLFDPTQPALSVIGDKTLTTINLENPSEVKQTDYVNTYFIRGEYQPSGNIIAIANGDDATVSLYDTETSKLSKVLNLPSGSYAVGFAPLDENILAVGGVGKIWLWDVAANQAITELAFPGKVVDVVFSDDGMWLVAGGEEGEIYLWRVNNANKPLQLEFSHSMQSNGSLNDIEFKFDGTHMATASEEGLVQIWDVVTGDEIARLRHPLAVWRISYTHDGKFLVSASGKIIFLWDVEAIPTYSADELTVEACKRLTRNFTAEEWTAFGLSGKQYPICPNLP